MKTKGKVVFLLGMLVLTASVLLAYRISERNSYLRIIRANWQTDLPYGCRQLYEIDNVIMCSCMMKERNSLFWRTGVFCPGLQRSG